MFSRWQFLFNPSEPTGGAAATAGATGGTSATSDPPATQSASTTPAASTSPSGTSAATGVAGQGSGSAPAAASTTPSWLDGFKQAGFQTNETDETKVRAQLLQSHQDAERLRPLAPYLSAYQQHAAEFQKYLQDQAQSQKLQSQQQGEDWTAQLGWNPPPYDPNWQYQIKRNDDGSLSVVNGADPAIVAKYQAYQQFRQGEVEKLLQNPHQYLEKTIRHLASQEAQRYANQGVGQYKEQQEANTFIEKNANWLFEQENGAAKINRVLNTQTGQYEERKALTQWGQLFVNKVNELGQAGLPPKLQEQYALQAVQNAYMVSPEYRALLAAQGTQPAAQSGTQQQPQTPLQQANGQFIKKANPAAPPAPNPNGGGNNKPSTPKVTRHNMQSVMFQRLQEANGATTN